MLREQDRAAYLALQPYTYVNTERSEEGRHVQLRIASRARTDDAQCPSCGSHVHICGSYRMRLRDMPVFSGTRQDVLRGSPVQASADAGDRACGNVGGLLPPLQPAGSHGAADHGDTLGDIHRIQKEVLGAVRLDEARRQGSLAARIREEGRLGRTCGRRRACTRRSSGRGGSSWRGGLDGMVQGSGEKRDTCLGEVRTAEGEEAWRPRHPRTPSHLHRKAGRLQQQDQGRKEDRL